MPPRAFCSSLAGFLLYFDHHGRWWTSNPRHKNTGEMMCVRPSFENAVDDEKERRRETKKRGEAQMGGSRGTKFPDSPKAQRRLA